MAVKKTIPLSPEIERYVENIAAVEGKTVSAVIQDAIRFARKQRLKKQFLDMQGYWSSKAKEKGILTKSDLKR